MSNGRCDYGDGRKAIWLNSSGGMFCGKHFRELVRQNYGAKFLRPENQYAVLEDGWSRIRPRSVKRE